jgi:integrase
MFHDNSPLQMGSPILFNISINPVSAVPNNPAAENVGERVLSFEELARLWNYTGDHLPLPTLLAMKIIIAFGGMRSGEVTRALISEFDFDTKVWSIPPERIKTGGKTGRWHLLPMTDLCCHLLRSQLSIHTNSPCLFPNRWDNMRHQSNTAIAHAVTRFCLAENFPSFKVQDLRRTVKTRMGELEFKITH